MMAKRAQLTGNDKLVLWEKWKGICNKCGLPIDKHKKGHLEWGHYPVPKSMGGSNGPENRAPEHAWCNRKDGSEVVTPLAAKVKRVAKRDLGIKKRSYWSEARERLLKTHRFDWRLGRMVLRDEPKP